MSWKIPEKTRPDRMRTSHPWSISRRLTVFYVLSVSIFLFLSNFFLYRVISSDLETQDTKFLADELQGIRSILKDGGQDAKALEEEINWEGNASKFLKYYVVVLDERSKVIAQTKGMDKLAGGDIPFPQPLNIGEYPEEGLKWRSPNKNSYLLMAGWAQVGVGPNRLLLKLAYDITDDETLVANYRKKLMWVLFAGILLSSGIGVLIARRGLAPLRKITGSIQRVSAVQLHERISREMWPKELSSLADAFDQMLHRLEESFNRLSQFSADLAHELRTPINILMGETEVSLTKVRSGEDYRQVLESNLEEYGRLSRMIDNLLFLARAENPEISIERTVSEVGEEIQGIIDYYDAVAKEKNVAVRLSGQATLTADFNLFRRAVSNVLSNALKHSNRGGEVHIRIEQKNDGSVEIQISDQGEGIGEEHLAKIFDRFYRANAARPNSPGGMGLGLAIVKSIMKLHGGTVSAKSSPSQGTTIILKFPSS